LDWAGVDEDGFSPFFCFNKFNRFSNNTQKNSSKTVKKKREGLTLVSKHQIHSQKDTRRIYQGKMEKKEKDETPKLFKYSSIPSGSGYKRER